MMGRFLLLPLCLLLVAAVPKKCLTAPGSCSCFELFDWDVTMEADHEDLKQAYRRFSLKNHPDKHPRSEYEAWEAVWLRGAACKEFLWDPKFMAAYAERLISMLALAKRKGWSEDRKDERLEEFHDEIGLHKKDGESIMKPRFQKRESPSEKMFLILDDFPSMRGEKLLDAHDEVKQMMPRVELTPTTVHLIGPRDFSKQIFSEKDDFTFDDIYERWQALPTCDILFLMDTTQSMGSAISAARMKVVEIAEGLVGHYSSLRIAFLGYRDQEDPVQFQEQGFTYDLSKIRSFLDSVEPRGGGDEPEDVIGALEKVLGFVWSSHTRLLIHIADAPGHPPRGRQRRADQILKDFASKSIRYAMLPIGRKADSMALEYSKFVELSSSRWPMKIIPMATATPDLFKEAVMDAAFDSSSHGGGTFLWQYVFNAIKDNPGSDQEVVIVTDGIDNDSDGDFRGTNGYSHMMERLTSLGISLPRITVSCIGNDECTKGRYRELAMATGGDFFHGADSKAAFVSHLLLTHKERVAKGKAQKQRYAQLTPSADRFSWFLPVPVESAATSDPVTSCKRDAYGVKVCSQVL